MNLYRLELKRVCKTRMTAILLAIALVLAVVMAYLPVTFIGWIIFQMMKAIHLYLMSCRIFCGLIIQCNSFADF